MDAEMINRMALEQLMHGNFVQAQNLFKTNKKLYPDYRTYNNLGFFLYENGMDLKNGKTKSATKLSQRYIQKSIEMNATVIALNNMGYISYELGDFESAERYYGRSLTIKNDKDVQYNYAASIYQLGQYQLANTISLELADYIEPATGLYVFSHIYANYGKKFEISVESITNKLDEIDRMLLYYLVEKYEDVVKLAENIFNGWSLSEKEWAILIDSLVKCEETNKLYNLLKYNDDESEFLNKIINDDMLRRKIIDSYKFFPIQIACCDYFGCSVHNISWDYKNKAT